jgi:sensor histidine kinase regulating citrate/malate metabolism
MATFQRTLYILLGCLVIGAIALVLAALKSFGSQAIQILLVGLFLLISILIFLILRNFNRLKTVEAGRQELENRLGFLVQHIKDYAIFLIDPEGRVMSWNQGAQQIKGYTADEVLGKPISIFYTEEESERGEPFQNLRHALEEGRYESVGLRPRVVNVDDQLLRNVLINLLSNASKYSSEQMPIDCCLTYQLGTISIRIRDLGIGIPADEQQYLFERFFRATNVTGVSGTGLGLSIVKKYLDLIGGNCTVESVPDKGSTFIVTLPDVRPAANTL